MKRLVGGIALNLSIQWQRTDSEEASMGTILEEERGISVGFNRFGPLLKRRGRSPLQDILDTNGVTWIWQRGQTWYIDLDKLRGEFSWLAIETWATGVAQVQAKSRESGLVVFEIFKEDYAVDRRQKIFLSHKGADKKWVRRYYRLLRTLGFDPWLDEEDMAAGDELHRKILEGFDLSCAAIFFLTPNFKDERYLRTEVNYAKEERTKKGERFRIICLRMPGKKQKEVEVPALLKEFLFKDPETHIDAVREIIQALPIQVGAPTWRPEIGKNDG